MRKFLFLLLLFTASAGADIAIPLAVTLSAINVSAMPSRQSCVAPCAVKFDAVGTTSAGVTSKPFHEISYTWGFGDSGAGSWSAWSGMGNSSKNVATGAVAAHVFETAGTYTVTLSLKDGTNTASAPPITITVTDPDTVYATTATVCFYNSTVGTGCPTGATQTQSSDFDAALAACIGTTKRCLFKKGDSFASSTTGTINATGPFTIGAYGSGALPIVTSTDISGVLDFTTASDVRVLDLDIRGNGATDTGLGINWASGTTSHVLIKGVSITEIGKGMSVAAVNTLTNGFFVENTVNNYYASGGNAFFGSLLGGALMGNTFGPVPAGGSGEHVLRLQHGRKVAITNNLLTTPNSTKHNLTIRAAAYVGDPADDSQYIYTSDNKYIGSINAQMVTLAPSADSTNERIYDIVMEREWFVSGASTTTVINDLATRSTVRNSVFDMSAAAATAISVDGQNTGGAPNPDGNSFYNNTFYSSLTTASTYGISLGGTINPVSNTTLKNNLCYTPNVTTNHTVLVSGGGVSGTTGAAGTFGNSSDAQCLTDPFNGVSPTTPATFLPAGSSYAIDGGATAPVWSDFFGAARTGTYDMGAVNP